MFSMEELNKLRVVDLRERLSALGLPTGGLKNDLIERIYNHYQAAEQNMSEDMQMDEGGGGGDENEDGTPQAEMDEGPNAEYSEAPPTASDMEEKVREQQRLLEEQSRQKEQDELFRMQQSALMEKQQEEQDKLLRLQQTAIKETGVQPTEFKNTSKMGPMSGAAIPPPGVVAVGVSTPVGMGPPGTTMPVMGGRPGGVNASVVVPSGPPSHGGFAPRPPQPGPPGSQTMQPPPMGNMNMQGNQGMAGPMQGGPPPPPGSLGPPGVGPMMQGHGGPGPPPGQQSMGGPRTPTSGGPPPRSPMQQQQPHPPGGPPRPQGPPPGEGGPPSGDAGEKPPPLMSLQVQPPKEEGAREVKLPQALEQALAFKTQRAKQVGVDPADMEKVEREGVTLIDGSEMPMNRSPMRQPGPAPQQKMQMPQPYVASSYDDEDDEREEDQENFKKTEKRKKKKKKRKGRNRFAEEQERLRQDRERERRREKEPIDNIEIEYIQEDMPIDITDPNYRYFSKIFECFRIAEPELPQEEIKEVAPIPALDLKKVPKMDIDDDDDDDDDDDEDKKDDPNKPKLSKRKMKLLKRMSIAELKQTVNRPDVVEMHDVTARDPKLLVLLKATRNTVPVPRHWCFKRKYLQGKRGIEKPPFELPDFIKRTGIMEMRAALQEKEDQKTLKAKMRDKVRPKMGKIDIDYQKLHDAFFKWQTKPKMTIHGDLYYEGKEFETKMKDKKPGEMSDDLRIALGMPVGGNAHKVPPPWLIAMQRYGPPPSYPNLKIPGLNSPIPDGCSFGYHAGGWGKPPVDNMGKPIYGDVFGTQSKEFENAVAEEEVERTLWGELESESEESSEEESDSDSDADDSGLVTPGETGLVTPSGMTSLPLAGLETPDLLELRKKHTETEMEGGGDTPALYTILPEKRTDNVGRAMMGSTHTYDLTAAAQVAAAAGGAARSSTQGVEVALDPSELDLVDTDAMAARYEATLREQQKGDDEDFSDMVAEHAAKQRNKRRAKHQDSQSKPQKKYKDFKF